MDAKFAALIESLHPSYEALLACPTHTGGHALPRDAPERGVYLFSENGNNLYVGRTDRLRDRYRDHTRLDHNNAPFAFKLARETSGHLKAKGGLTRKALQVHEPFALEFVKAAERVKKMDFRWVGETNPERQFLLEFYATIALGARYNDFENH